MNKRRNAWEAYRAIDGRTIGEMTILVEIKDKGHWKFLSLRWHAHLRWEERVDANNEDEIFEMMEWWEREWVGDEDELGDWHVIPILMMKYGAAT